MTDFERELTNLINRQSIENQSNTPDFMLARFLMDCLAAYNVATVARDNWYGLGHDVKHGEVRQLGDEPNEP